ncbi:glycosyltransferase family 2 protein [Intrasporangium calvum]|uniref:glycosyltransferase family 2 protein n=1 Tax=Intrasporangium calvum TaxID=53358 RepID=UPI000DF62737|nr:glycosyltransferase family 2 protein [Intrasporangium calvum]AXG12820.1 glycosyltransferase family 2 protein [Intrasporangium calvum]
MLALVTSLRHPWNSRSYGQVEAIFAQSARSWVRQQSDAFGVVVVGNQAPRVQLPERVRFVEVDFPPPSSHRGPQTGTAAVLKDKGSKLAVGLLAARQQHPDLTHVMFVDADDFVSRRLAGFVADRSGEAGWTVTHGWRYHAGRRAVRPVRGDFHLHCGSSHIVRHDLYPRVDLPLTASQDELYSAFGERLERWFGSHLHIHDDLPLVPLPFPGALYRVGTGEAHSGASMGGLGRPVSRAVAEEFGVERTGVAPWSFARAVLPSAGAFTGRIGNVLPALSRGGERAAPAPGAPTDEAGR